MRLAASEKPLKYFSKTAHWDHAPAVDSGRIPCQAGEGHQDPGRSIEG